MWPLLTLWGVPGDASLLEIDLYKMKPEEGFLGSESLCYLPQTSCTDRTPMQLPARRQFGVPMISVWPVLRLWKASDYSDRWMSTHGQCGSRPSRPVLRQRLRQLAIGQGTPQRKAVVPSSSARVLSQRSCPSLTLTSGSADRRARPYLPRLICDTPVLCRHGKDAIR